MKPTPNLPPDHATYVALLDGEEGVHPLPHALYLSLVRGEGEAPDFAGRTMTLADWYVRLREGAPDVVVKETYTPITFDARGKVDWASTNSGISYQAILAEEREHAWWPTATQRDKMRAAVFAGELSHGASTDSGSGESCQSMERP
jgi:hypothetical protein